jgi:peptide-methionine (S)-S-oxide reductase
MSQETAVFGGGCFWCTEAVFKMLRGVLSVRPGYAGGTGAPTSDQVSSGNTGHAEVIEIVFDPVHISFRDLLTVFFASHDPTTINRQGADVGTQYRSIILYTSEAQKVTAQTFIEEINASNALGKDIVTEIKPLEKFYEAEEYHKNYYETHPENAYCEIVINPKLDKVKKQFAELLKKQS